MRESIDSDSDSIVGVSYKIRQDSIRYKMIQHDTAYQETHTAILNMTF